MGTFELSPTSGGGQIHSIVGEFLHENSAPRQAVYIGPWIPKCAEALSHREGQIVDQKIQHKRFVNVKVFPSRDIEQGGSDIFGLLPPSKEASF